MLSYADLTDKELMEQMSQLEREFDHVLDGANTRARGLRMIGMELRSEKLHAEMAKRNAGNA
tara:strand:- start:238 stop:423 length:186 start_codon:yes stop_codon:yes gene_type:complete